jgi:SAM-dependent methyltransferase
MIRDGAQANSITELLRTAETQGWRAALYYHYKSQIAQGGTTAEDERMADWRFLLPETHGGRTLVLGCGWGTVAVALAKDSEHLCAIDCSWETLAFLNILRKQEQLDNLSLMQANRWPMLPFSDNSFDLISINPAYWDPEDTTPLRMVVQHTHRLLERGGMVHLVVGNAWSPVHLLQRAKRQTGPALHAFPEYRQLLQAEGFTEIQMYAPLPHYKGVPLFYVPLDDAGALAFFFHDLFPLFERVSPEVKRVYARYYLLAKVGVWIALQLRLTWLAKFFVPGYHIFARKA